MWKLGVNIHTMITQNTILPPLILRNIFTQVSHSDTDLTPQVYIHIHIPLSVSLSLCSSTFPCQSYTHFIKSLAIALAMAYRPQGRYLPSSGLGESSSSQDNAAIQDDNTKNEGSPSSGARHHATIPSTAEEDIEQGKTDIH